MLYRACALFVVTASLAACGGGSDRPSSTTRAAPTTVESNCLAAVANEVGVGDVSLIRSEVSEGDGLTNVYVRVPDAQAPWICRATSSGAVQEVMYSGSEGAL